MRSKEHGPYQKRVDMSAVCFIIIFAYVVIALFVKYWDTILIFKKGG